jgi:hypothetical protein
LLRLVGHADQFAKETFAEETGRITQGAMSWHDPPELRLVNLLKVQGDGLLRVHGQDNLGALMAPWSQAKGHAEVLLEIKMPGDHLGVPAVQRAVLRRQALWVQRVEAEEPPWPGEEPLWVAAPHVPDWLRRARKLARVGRGCYLVRPSWTPFVWIAANELPLRDELVPFLVARSGKPLDDFARWVAPRRPLNWVLSMIEFTTMSANVSDELLHNFRKSDDPVVEARRQRILQVLLEYSPQVRQELIDQGIEKGIEKGLLEARAALRGVLERRQLSLTPDQVARIEQCADFATLRRWMMQAITATTASEALQ